MPRLLCTMPHGMLFGARGLPGTAWLCATLRAAIACVSCMAIATPRGARLFQAGPVVRRAARA
eukprot:13385016-Alexandrium_andersonii.AAC.1